VFLLPLVPLLGTEHSSDCSIVFRSRAGFLLDVVPAGMKLAAVMSRSNTGSEPDQAPVDGVFCSPYQACRAESTLPRVSWWETLS
jgi:hypothetical protein